MPRAAAQRLAEAQRGPFARVLTGGERRLIAEAFGGSVRLDPVRIVNGPALNVVAFSAFAKGNPAITLGETIYINASRFRSDLSTSQEDVALLLHEFFHVTQYRRMGFDSFLARYGYEMSRHGFDPGRLYDYETRSTGFAQETIEGQAEMVGVYSGLKFIGDAKGMNALAPRLRGSGVYGF